ncbi:MAG: DNA mismatch repair endonuclease MutL, partial [Anaerolineaceae bacterium]
MPIQILSEKIASQIAAGEVVERPSSVVKELIENAIDAGAKSVTVEIRSAGKQLIEVVDDGSGIPAGELPLALARHATSKLSSAEDLFNIQTLGFRGEALASIGSVSRLTLTSKTETEVAGSRIHLDGGQMDALSQVPSPTGSSVRVEGLFFNVPARLKFLKADSTENRQISGLLTRYAMAYPAIRWSLVQDGKIIFQSTGSGDKLEILQALYGTQDAKLLLPIKFIDREITVSGYVSSLSLNRSNRRDITLFVNGRWVQDASLTASVIKAYNTLLMVGRYPVAILFIHIPPPLVDVNVHPSKAEVRFRDPDVVFNALQRAVKHGLLAYSPIPELRPANLWGRQAELEKFDETAAGFMPPQAFGRDKPAGFEAGSSLLQSNLPV